MNEITKTNFVKIDFTTPINNIVTCLVCKVSEPLPVTDNVIPKGVDSGHGSLRVLKTSKQVLDYFYKTHLELHWPTPVKQKAATRDGMRKYFNKW